MPIYKNSHIRIYSWRLCILSKCSGIGVCLFIYVEFIMVCQKRKGKTLGGDLARNRERDAVQFSCWKLLYQLSSDQWGVLFPLAGYSISRFCAGQPKNIVSIKHPPPPPPDDELELVDDVAPDWIVAVNSAHTG